jgi:hypothetical protein
MFNEVNFSIISNFVMIFVLILLLIRLKQPICKSEHPELPTRTPGCQTFEGVGIGAPPSPTPLSFLLYFW